MKRWVKITVVIISAPLLCVAGLLGFVWLRGIPSYPVQNVPELVIEASPGRITEGRRLVQLLCAKCHADTETGLLTGRLLADAPPEFGPIYSKNITQDPTHGIGHWTDGEIVFYLRTGIRPYDGRFSPPPMVKMSRVSDEHIASIVAFLRSDDPLVRPQPVPDHESEPTLLMKMLATFVFEPFAYPLGPVEAPPTQDEVAYGKYLVDELLDCYGCHSADWTTIDAAVPENSEGYLGGGNTLVDFEGRRVYTANITFDEETGIGTWTRDDLARALRDGFRPDGSAIRYPMERFVELRDDEVDAIYAYLRTVPEIHNPRRPWEYELEAVEAGEEVYRKYGCHTCHGDSGVGIGDLRPANRKYPTDEALIAFIRNPQATFPNTRMPRWEGIIAEEDYAPLAAYVRELSRASER